MTAPGSRAAATAATVLVCVMLAGTIAAAVSNIWPPRTSELLWRVVMVTQAVNGLGNAITGLGLAALLGLLLGRVWLLSLAAVVSALAALMTSSALLLMILDYIQFRGALRPDTVAQWDFSVVLTLALGGLGILVLTALAWGGFRGVDGVRKRQRAVRPAPARIPG